MTRGKMPPMTESPAPSWPFLITGAIISSLAVAGIWAWQGWASAIWASWAACFIVAEAHGVWSETDGDTLSEQIRIFFRTKTPAGRWAFFVTLGTLFAWLSWHIVG